MAVSVAQVTLNATTATLLYEATVNGITTVKTKVNGTMYVGPDVTVTSMTGYQVQGVETAFLLTRDDAIYAISGAGAPVAMVAAMTDH